MEEIDSSSRSRLILSKVFNELMEWSSTEKKDLYRFNWCPFHLAVVHGYALELTLSPDSRLLNTAKLLEEETEISGGYKDEKVASFMDELEEVFVVPEQHQLLEKHGVVAGFIDMLLRLLQNIPDSVNSLRTKIDHLQKELRFLLAVLGDNLLICYQHEQVRTLIIEFEAVANQAGSVVHFIFFKTKAHNTLKGIGRGYSMFLSHVKNLKDAVIEFAKLHQAFPETYILARKTDSLMVSISIMDSLLYDLDDLLIEEDHVFADVYDELKSLQKGLTLLNSSIKSCPHSDYLEENGLPIKEVAYEAEYLLYSYFDGDAPQAYFSIRVSHVVCKIMSITAEINNHDNIGVSKFAELLLLNKKITDVVGNNRDNILSKLFEELIKWRSTRMRENRGSYKFTWSQFHLSVVHGYVLKLNLNSDSRLLSQAWLLERELKYNGYKDQKVASFMAELREVFVVPEQHHSFEGQDSTVDKHGLVAGFIDMLLCLLFDTPYSFYSMITEIHHLQKELRFLLAVLGDKSFIFQHPREQVWNLLIEFETVANAAGSTVYLIIFKTKAHNTHIEISRCCTKFLRHVKKLKDAVIESAKLQQAIPETSSTTRKTDSLLVSIFIMESLFHDLDDLLIEEDHVIADVYDELRSLKQGLTLLNSSIRIRQHSKMEEYLKEYGMSINEVAYEAEYLINSLLDESAPHTYFSIRLSQVVCRIESIMLGIEETKKKHCDNIGVSKFSQLSLHNKRMADVENVILSKVFEELIKWRSRRMRENPDLYKFIWSQFHLSVVHGYVLKLNFNSESRLLNQARLLKDEFKLVDGYIDHKVASFMVELREVFVVPEQHQYSFEVKHGLVASFIDMLLRLLHDTPDSVNSMKTEIDHLRKELRFLLAVLGDKPFIFQHQEEQAWNILTEFEAVANEAGCIVHFIFFKTKCRESLKGIGKRGDKYLSAMNQLKAAVIEFANLQQSIPEAYTTQKTDSLMVSISIMDSLIHDLDGLLIEKNHVIADVYDQVKSLQQGLILLNSCIKKILHSKMGENLKENGIPIVEVAYEAEYLINSFVDGCAPHTYFSIRLSQVVRKVIFITTVIQENHKNNCDDVGVSKFVQLSLQNKRNADVEDAIVGFDDKAEEVLLHLKDGEANLQIVSIHGMPGVGKSTLAKKLYNHPSLKSWYDQRSWCVVSQHYDKKSLLIDILDGLEGVHSWDKNDILIADEDKLIVFLHQSLKYRRYLIVIDDIWSLDAWDDLQTCFPNEEKSSRILFTSRNKEVAPPNSISYELLPTSDEHCWEILKEKVFQKEPCPPHLLKVGKEIAKSCHGLPLVVLLVVSILSNKDKEESTWKEVKGDLSSYVFSDDKKNSITQLLEMSYDNLQDHLKPCFLYFGAFPGARQIRVPDLLRLWISEGFVHKEERKSPESVAKQYLMELIDKSLVTVRERRSDGGIKTCIIHDLLHEFCLQKCTDDILHSVVDKRYSMNEKHQRLRVHYFVKAPKLALFGLHVRSIFGCFPTSGFLNMRLLKVLDLMGVICYESLNEIKVLINLRHLAIGYGFPSQQPQVLELALISTLLKLEFLIVKSQFYLVCTPSQLAKMMKLRHVQVYTSVQFGEELCNSYSNSSQDNNLDFLSNVTISNAKDEQMLRCSSHLRRLKCKCHPFPGEESKEEHRYPDFSFFTELESLHMEADPNRRVSNISLPSNIVELTLYGLSMPWEKMSSIGRLKKLRDLKLISSFVGDTWTTEDDEFEQLQYLMLKEIYDLKVWNVKTWHHFPNLRGLILEDCHYLREIPCEVGDIPTMQSIQIKGMCQESLKYSAQVSEQEQKDAGNEELKFEYPKLDVEKYQTGSSLFVLYPLDW